MRRFIICLACSMCLLAGAMAHAEDGSAGAGLGLEAGFVGKADFADRDGGYGVARIGASASWGIVSLSYELRSFDWDGAGGLPIGNGVEDPWDELHALALAASDNGFWDQDWGWFWLAGLSSAFEEEMDGSLGASLGGGLVRALGENWALRLGLIGFVHPVGTKVLPTVSATWRQGAPEGFSATIGAPESSITYRFGPQWAMRLGASLETGLWRLADDSVVEPEGYVSEMGVRAGLYALWSPMEGLDLAFGPEVVFARRMSVYNDDGEKRLSHGADPALGAQARLGWRF